MSDSILPELLSVQAKAVVDRAKALGLVWTLRPATVNTAYAATPSVIYDGDTEQVGVVSLVGELQPQGRVMMLQVPPAGNFVLGRLSTSGGTTVKQIPTFRGETESAADVTLTVAAQVITPLTTLVLTSDGEYIITANVDIDYFSAGTNNLVAAAMQIDGVGLTAQVVFQTNASGNRVTLSHTWHGELTAGSHTFQMIAAKALATGGIATRAVNTSFVYEIWQ